MQFSARFRGIVMGIGQLRARVIVPDLFDCIDFNNWFFKELIVRCFLFCRFV